MPGDEQRSALVGFARRVLIAVAIVALALFAWQISRLLLLVFAGALLAVLLNWAAGLVARRTPLSRTWGLALVVAVAVALLVVGGSLFGAQLADQFRQLAQRLPDAVSQIEDTLEETGWGRYLIGGIEGEGVRSVIGSGLVPRITGIASTAVQLIADFLIVLFVGLYFAVSPMSYRNGAVMLLPERHRRRGREALDAIGDGLLRWLLGQFVSMVTVGVLTAVGLMLLGIPMALALAVLAALLEFVPIIGPLLAAVPAVLLAFTQGPMLALYVALLYLAIQQIESYVVLPLAQRWAVALPPALTVMAAVAMGLTFGFLGILIATPVLVAVLVLVRKVYIEDILGSQSDK